MKALLDQNLSFRLIEVLLPLFPDSLHVRDLGLTGDDDERIWTIAKKDGFVQRVGVSAAAITPTSDNELTLSVYQPTRYWRSRTRGRRPRPVQHDRLTA